MSRHGLDEDSTVYIDDVDSARVEPSRVERPAASESFDETVFANDVSISDATPTGANDSDPAGSATHDGVDRTQHALQAMELGVLFRHRFQSAIFGIQPRWKIRMTTPDGMSTDGGTKARQTLVLYKEGAPKVGTFIVGFVDKTKNRASLKTYDVMGRAYELRYGAEFEMVESEYERLLDELRKFAAGLGFSVQMLTMDDAAPGRPTGGRKKPKKKGEPRQFSARAVLLTLAVILGLGVLIGYALGG